MNQNIKYFLRHPLVVAVATVILTLIVSRQPATKKIEYIISKTNNLVNVSDSDVENLKLIFKGKSVENLS
jgi:hypothetical protein